MIKMNLKKVKFDLKLAGEFASQGNITYAKKISTAIDKLEKTNLTEEAKQAYLAEIIVRAEKMEYTCRKNLFD